MSTRQGIFVVLGVFSFWGMNSMAQTNGEYYPESQVQAGFANEQYEFTVKNLDRIEKPNPFFSMDSISIVQCDIGVPPEGDCPIAIAITPDGGLAIISNRDSDNITLLNLETNQVDTVILVGDYPRDVAITPDGNYAFIANAFSGDVSVLDIPSMSILTTITTGGEPVSVKITSDGKKALVGVLDTLILSVIDIDSMKIVNTIENIPLRIFGGGGSLINGKNWFRFTQFDVTPDGNTVIFPYRSEDEILFYDLLTGVCTDTIFLSLDWWPTLIDISSDGSFAVVACMKDPAELAIIDVPNRSLLTTLCLNDRISCDRVVITPNDSLVLVGISNYTAIVDISTPDSPSILANLYTASPKEIGVSSDSKYGFIITYNPKIVDLNSLSIVKTFDIGRLQDIGGVSPVDYKAVTAGFITVEKTHIFNIDGASGSLEAALQSGLPPEGDAPVECIFIPDTTLVVALNATSENVSLIDASKDSVIGIIDAGRSPFGIAVTHNGDYAVVVNAGDNNVSIIDLNIQDKVASVSTASYPMKVTITPDDSLALVTTIGSTGNDYVSIVKLNGATSSHLTDIPVGSVGSRTVINSNETSEIAISPDGTTAIIANNMSNNVSIIDIPSLTEVKRVAVGGFPMKVVFNSTGDTVLVSNMDTDNISVIYVAGINSELVTNVPCGDMPYDIVITPDNRYALVGNIQGKSVAVIDMSDYAVTQTIPLGDFKPRDIAITEEGELLCANAALFLTGGAGDLQLIEFDSTSYNLTEIAAFDYALFSLDYQNGYAVVTHPSVDLISIVKETLSGISGERPTETISSLFQIYPNPFSNVTFITYGVRLRCDVLLEVYNITGVLMEKILAGTQNPGVHRLRWLAQAIPAGVYFLRLISQTETQIKKVLVIR